ncbi:MAG: cyclic lactone autoinducer peptide [Clostridiales bacterium]|nr:cyclic lactone autoinducer peptide [Clostridiales bacterium]
MTKHDLRYTLLKQMEKISRKTARGARQDPEPPWPICPYILHQPKRPKK